MTKTLSERAVNRWVDSQGLHDDARSPGVYAVELETPGASIPGVIRRWADHFDADMPGAYATRLADAQRFVYVGAHGKSVYHRLCQHATGEKSATIMDVWPPVAVAGILRTDDPGAMEFNYTQEYAREDGTVAWMNGQLYG